MKQGKTMNRLHPDFIITALKGLGCAALLTATLASPVAAQSASDGVYKSGAERIDAGDNIRRLSQQIAAAACLIDAGVGVDRYRSVIFDAMSDYDRLIAALNTGDPDLGIGAPEEGRRMLTSLRGLSLQWDRYKAAAAERITGQVSEDGPDYISRQNLNVMHSGKYVVSEVINHYTIPPALLQGDAFTLSIAARQRSLSQQIAKEACGVITGNETMGSLARLNSTVRRFDASHQALLNGFAGAGVSPPPNATIAEGLAGITANWDALRATLDGVSATGNAAMADALYQQLDVISAEYDALVALYVTDSKSGI